MKTWSFNTTDYSGVVTAESVEMALIWIAHKHQITLNKTDLVPVVTSGRWVRMFKHEQTTNTKE